MTELVGSNVWTDKESYRFKWYRDQHEAMAVLSDLKQTDGRGPYGVPYTNCEELPNGGGSFKR